MKFSVGIMALMCIIGCPGQETSGVVEPDVAQPAEDVEEVVEDVEEEVQEDLGPPPECATSEDCEDHVECTKNVCNYGTCQFQPNAEYCKDSDECTIELCNPKGNVFGGCEYKAKPCDDGDDCTSDSCDKGLGCVFATDGGVCKDSNPCTEDLCELNGCAHVPMNCDDENPGTFDGCSNQSGCYHYTKECGEGFPCKHSDPCMVSTCNPDFSCSHEMKVCKDDVACTFDVCNGGECVFKPKDNLCPASGNKCVASFCDPMFGCTFGDIECDDKKPYTFDYCDPNVGCVFEDNGEWCETANQCEDGDPCTYSVCNPDNSCSYIPKVCNDKIECTIDECVGDGECKHTPDNELCPNGLVCNPMAEACTPCASFMDCDDGNKCTNDYCDGMEGLGSTGTWECQSYFKCGDMECNPEEGECIEPVVECDIDEHCGISDDVCTDFACEENECVVNLAIDGQICDEDECGVTTCLEGVCNDMIELQICDDGNSCTQDICDGKIGCTHLEMKDGSSCNDNNWCSKSASCQFGFCLQDEEKYCDDGDPCTKDSCDESFGCIHDNLGVCEETECIMGNFWGCLKCSDGPCENGLEDVTGECLAFGGGSDLSCVHKTSMQEGTGWMCFNVPTHASQILDDDEVVESQSFASEYIEYHWVTSKVVITFTQFPGTGIPKINECACINGMGFLTKPTLLDLNEDSMVMKCTTD